MARLLVAGASGLVGRHILREARSSGHSVRAISRDPKKLAGSADEVLVADLTRPESLRHACDGVDAIISAAGASLKLDRSEQATYMEIDYAGNRNLLEAARAAGIGKFVYISLFAAEKLMDTAYARAHEEFVSDLRGFPLRSTVIRPTGFFGTMLEILKMAKQGRGVVLGDGRARTNPIDEADVARAAIEGLDQDGEIACGGPEVLSRREITELAFEVMSRKPKVYRVPPGFMKLAISPVRIYDPRLHDFFAFGIAVSQVDVVAPAYGVSRLRDYFARNTVAR